MNGMRAAIQRAASSAALMATRAVGVAVLYSHRGADDVKIWTIPGDEMTIENEMLETDVAITEKEFKVPALQPTMMIDAEDDDQCCSADLTAASATEAGEEENSGYWIPTVEDRITYNGAQWFVKKITANANRSLYFVQAERKQARRVK